MAFIRAWVGRGWLVKVTSGVFGDDRSAVLVFRAMAKLARGMGGGTIKGG